MVSTRSHDDTLPHSVPQTIQEPASEGRLGKRKTDHSEENTPSKRVKRSVAADAAVEVAVAVVIPLPTPDKSKKLPERLRNNSSQSGEKGSRARIITGPTTDDKEEDLKTAGKNLPEPEPERRPSDTSPLAESLGEEHLRSPQKVRAKIKTFGSEDMENLIQELRPQSPHSQPKSETPGAHDQDSDDEAPEEGVTAAGQDMVAAATAKAAELSVRKEAEQRAKRKAHDERMKKQARVGEKKEGSKRKQTASALARDGFQDAQYPVFSKLAPTNVPLPALLPQGLLDAEPIRRPMAPPPQVAMKLQADVKSKVLFNKRDNPPKDIKRGNTKIRVLQAEPTTLPPKASKLGREIRESWLLGQRGSNPTAWVPRQKPVGGFVRNPNDSFSGKMLKG